MNASKHPWGQYGLVNLCVPPVSLAEVFFFCFMFVLFLFLFSCLFGVNKIPLKKLEKIGLVCTHFL